MLKLFYLYNFFKMIKIYPDGNCFYRALSKFMTDKEDYHHYFRNTIYNYIEDNKDIIFKYNEYLDYGNTYIHYLDYIDKIKELSFYTGETEIITAVKLFKINIYVFEHNESENYYKFLYKFENENHMTYTLILEYLYLDKIKKSGEHFQLSLLERNKFDLSKLIKINQPNNSNVINSKNCNYNNVDLF